MLTIKEDLNKLAALIVIVWVCCFLSVPPLTPHILSFSLSSLLSVSLCFTCASLTFLSQCLRSVCSPPDSFSCYLARLGSNVCWLMVVFLLCSVWFFESISLGYWIFPEPFWNLFAHSDWLPCFDISLLLHLIAPHFAFNIQELNSLPVSVEPAPGSSWCSNWQTKSISVLFVSPHLFNFSAVFVWIWALWVNMDVPGRPPLRALGNCLTWEV